MHGKCFLTSGLVSRCFRNPETRTGGGGEGTPILDLPGCAAQQGVFLRQKLCDRVSFSDKNYATRYYN